MLGAQHVAAQHACSDACSGLGTHVTPNRLTGLRQISADLSLSSLRLRYRGLPINDGMLSVVARSLLCLFQSLSTLSSSPKPILMLWHLFAAGTSLVGLTFFHTERTTGAIQFACRLFLFLQVPFLADTGQFGLRPALTTLSAVLAGARTTCIQCMNLRTTVVGVNPNMQLGQLSIKMHRLATFNRLALLSSHTVTGRKASRKWRESIRVVNGSNMSLGQWIEDRCNAADAGIHDDAEVPALQLLACEPLCPAGLPEESSRVSVYWPADDEWYHGEVKDVDDCGRSHVKYDDGQVEILYFAVERYKLAEPTCNSGALKSSSLPYICNFACCVTVLLPVNAICSEA